MALDKEVKCGDIIGFCSIRAVPMLPGINARDQAFILF
jgi:hypothetical protein